MAARDCDRLRDCAKRLDQMPLGSGAIAGSTIILDREAVAQELGFSAVTQNSMDAVSDRDFACELLSVLAVLGMHLSRLSEDVILWTSAEFGYLELSDSHTTGSSLMPQKKNPDIAELTRGKTGRLYGNLISLLTTMKGLPLAYNRDMQEDKEAIFDSVDTTKAALQIFAEMMDRAIFLEDKMAQAAADPSLLATDLADRLVQGGIPFRKAHEIVGRLVALAARKGVPLDRLEPQDFLNAAPALTPELWRETFQVRSALAARRASGAPSGENIARRLAHWRNVLT
jgi:argininosuccinate lyase